MPDTTPTGRSGSDPKREPPPRALVEAAEHDYHRMIGLLHQTTSSVRSLLGQGHTDFEAVADVWRSLRQQQDRPAIMLLAAVAIVQLAKVPEPPLLG